MPQQKLQQVVTLTNKSHRGLFIQFAGQGNQYLKELRRVYLSEPATQNFINLAISKIKDETKRCEEAGLDFYRHGMEIDRWIEKEETAPPFSYLLSSPVSYPLIFLTRIANYLSLIKEGPTHPQLCHSLKGTRGFSTGIVAALLSALNVPHPKWLERALACQGLFVWAGAKVQECTARQNVQLELAPNEASCMARVEGIPLFALQNALSQSSCGVELAYVLENKRLVISAMPAQLEQFKEELLQGHKEAKWSYILSSTAAHSAYHEPVIEPLQDEAKRLGVHFRAEELACPVYEVGEGFDLRESKDIIGKTLESFLTAKGWWPKQISLVKKGEISHVISCGPTTGIAGLTTLLTKGMDVTVFRCAVPLGRKLFAEAAAKLLI